MQAKLWSYIFLILGAATLLCACGKQKPAEISSEAQSTNPAVTSVVAKPEIGVMKDAVSITLDQFNREYDSRGTIKLEEGDTYSGSGFITDTAQLADGQKILCTMELRIESRITKVTKSKVSIEGHQKRSTAESQCEDFERDSDFSDVRKLDFKGIDFKDKKNVRIHKGHYMGSMHYQLEAEYLDNGKTYYSKVILSPKFPNFMYSYMVIKEGSKDGRILQELSNQITLNRR